MTEHEIAKRARAVFAKQEKLKAQMRRLDSEILSLVNDYRVATRTWITRPEQLKLAVEGRQGRLAA